MKKYKPLLTVIFTIFFSFIFLFQADANLLAECHICNNTGKCNQCNGSNLVVCDLCNGSGTLACDQCNNGYVSCSCCNGTKQLPCNNCTYPNCPNCGSTKIQPCTQCNETGLEICNSCKGTLQATCNRCNGSGSSSCNGCGGSCQCNTCLGTGYLSGNNNGINNVPKNGDTVQTLSGAYITWGSSSNNSNSTSSSNTSSANSSNSSSSSKSTSSINSSTSNSSDTSTSTNNTTNIANTNNDVTPIPSVSTKEPMDATSSSTEEVILDNGVVKSFINTFNMSEEEQHIYTYLSDDAKTDIKNKVAQIVLTGKSGELLDEYKENVQNLLGEIPIEDAKINAYNFEGHLSLDFPVAVSINIKTGIYSESDIVNMYHVLEDNTIESLGEAKKTIENGNVVKLTFYTKGFSSFISSTEHFDLSQQLIERETSKNTTDKKEKAIQNSFNKTSSSSDSNNNNIIGLIKVIAMLVSIAVVSVIIFRKRNIKELHTNNNEDDT